jgi:hypothetical protein
MKTKILFLLCLLLGFGFTQLSAQKSKNGTGSVPEIIVWDGYYVDIPVGCDKAVVDRLIGKVTIHVVKHYKQGVFSWEIASYDGEVKSDITGEVFQIKDHWKYNSSTPDFGTGHCTLRGSYGSRYLLFYTLDFITDTFTYTKAVCN